MKTDVDAKQNKLGAWEALSLNIKIFIHLVMYIYASYKSKCTKVLRHQIIFSQEIIIITSFPRG